MSQVWKEPESNVRISISSILLAERIPETVLLAHVCMS